MRAVLIGLCVFMALSGTALAQGPSDALAKLHDDLRLTADQQAAWRDYMASIGEGGQMRARRQAAEMMLPQLPTPRRLALLDATMTQDLADFHRQSHAIEAFYDGLTPDQQRTFDHDSLPPQAGGR